MKIDDGFKHGETAKPHAFIQYKGTDICMDFHCDCSDEILHFDGYFAYAVKCPKCKTVWQMPFILYPRKASKDTDPYWIENAKLLMRDES